MRIGLGRWTGIEVAMYHDDLRMGLRITRRGKTVHEETAPVRNIDEGSQWDLSQNYRLRARLFRLGSRTVLWGYHTFWLHPWFVALGWFRVGYGVPWDPRLWVAFMVHDLGYWGSPNLDGPEGEQHPEWGARVMERWFDAHRLIGRWGSWRWLVSMVCDRIWGDIKTLPYNAPSWYMFCRYHSRFLARADGKRYSVLCVADKQAMLLYPRWLFLLLVRSTGEVREYIQTANRKGEVEETEVIDRWYTNVMAYTQRWVTRHRDGRADTMTHDDDKRTKSDDGVWL